MISKNLDGDKFMTIYIKIEDHECFGIGNGCKVHTDEIAHAFFNL